MPIIIIDGGNELPPAAAMKKDMAAAFHPVPAELTTVKLAACALEAERMYASTELLVSEFIVPLVPSVHGLLVAENSPDPEPGSAIALMYSRDPEFVGVMLGVFTGVVPEVEKAPISLSKVQVPPVYEYSIAWIDSPCATLGVAVNVIAALDGALSI
jgi:hypothetical protein